MPRLKEAVAILKRGGLVGFPTESFFALGADATNAEAIKLIYTVKERDRRKPIAVIAADFGQVQRFFRLTPAEKRIGKKSWPGSLTLLLQPRISLFSGRRKAIAASQLGSRKVGVRVPPHAQARRLAKLLGRPLTATSLNLSGQPPSKSLSVLKKRFPGLHLVSGHCGRYLQPSTVAEITGPAARIIRPGAVKI